MDIAAGPLGKTTLTFVMSPGYEEPVEEEEDIHERRSEIFYLCPI